ncbi:MAG: hypothetical protein K6A76_05290 [Oribacterium sp.]|nr:hypothetical protein [Oribacterium sp.]
MKLEIVMSNGKVAVITGGAHGIGKAIAALFRADDVTLHIIDKTPGEWFVVNIKVEDGPPRHNLWMNCSKAKNHGIRFIDVSDALLRCAEENRWEGRDYEKL